MYIKIGSSTILRPEPRIIAFIALFESPSLLRIEFATFVKKNTKLPPKITLEYSTPSSVVFPAPLYIKRSLKKTSPNAVKATVRVSIITKVCRATLSTPALSLAPIRLEIADPPPTPNPLVTAIWTRKKGKENPTAARASAPRPETQKVSVRL